jgi:2-oxo-4-hydroxy-4-carboxy-5-ureidoimidazoline decarboxylase
MIALSTVNDMPEADFVAQFGDVAEHSPWVAEAAARARPYPSRDAMVKAFAAAVAAAPEARRLDLVRAHPDLAGRAALAGEIAADSRREQAGAGLDTLSAAEFARFTELNRRYRERFGFPFILAVKGATKHDILAAFEARLGHTRAAETETALAQIARIFRFRIEDRVAPDSP